MGRKTGKGRFGLLSLQIVTAPSTLPSKTGAGGTPGGVGQFFLGLAMAVVGGYLLLNQVQVATSFWSFGPYGGFGLTLLPLLVGVGFLFYDGKSSIGWLLVGLGAAIILASILMHWTSTSVRRRSSTQLSCSDCCSAVLA
jgi:hypothetical protein